MIKSLSLCVIIFCLTACATRPTADQENLSDLNLEIAMTYLNKGLPIMAKRHLLLALQEAPNNPAVLAAYGLYLEKVGDSQAQYYYQKAVDLNPHSAIARNNYGTYLCRHQQYSAAITEFQQAIDQPEYLYVADAYENMGICSYLDHQYPQAKNYFTKALEYDPRLSLSRGMLKQLSSECQPQLSS